MFVLFVFPQRGSSPSSRSDSCTDIFAGNVCSGLQYSEMYKIVMCMLAGYMPFGPNQELRSQFSIVLPELLNQVCGRDADPTSTCVFKKCRVFTDSIEMAVA